MRRILLIYPSSITHRKLPKADTFADLSCQPCNKALNFCFGHNYFKLNALTAATDHGPRTCSAIETFENAMATGANFFEGGWLTDKSRAAMKRMIGRSGGNTGNGQEPDFKKEHTPGELQI